MADILLFVRHGWENIRKQRNIWLFSALPILTQVFNIFQIERDADFLPQFISLVISFVSITLSFIGTIGVLYLVYCCLIGEPVTIQEVLFAVKKFSGRIIGCSCLGFLAFSPLFFWAVSASIKSSVRPLELSGKTIIALLPLSMFSALWQFTIVVFFENDWGIRQSLDKAWIVFKSHFGILAILGLIVAITFRAHIVISGILTVLIQSGFDITSINNFNIINPSVSLGRNLLFIFINGVGQIIFYPISASAFISAYLKYSDVKLPYQMRVR